MNKKQRETIEKIGRVAFRHEGEYWNAYYALPDTMDGALLLASIHMGAVSGADNEARKSEFMMLATSIANDILRAAGHPITLGQPIAAPPHERAGNA